MQHGKKKHEKCAAWNKYNTEKVYNEKNKTQGKCIMKEAKHGKSATWKMCNINKV